MFKPESQTDVEDFHTNFNIFGENKMCEELEEEMEAEERDRETHPLPSGPVERQRWMTTHCGWDANCQRYCNITSWNHSS